MGGFTTCGEFIVNAMKMAMPPHNSTNSTNSTQPPPPMVPCGCMVVDNSTSTMALGTISLPLDYRADYLFQTDVSVTANMGVWCMPPLPSCVQGAAGLGCDSLEKQFDSQLAVDIQDGF